jgi:hypothetical protein
LPIPFVVQWIGHSPPKGEILGLGKERKLAAEDDLLCRCIQHEIDHLDGKLFVDKTANELEMKKILEEAGFGNIVSPASPIMIG